MLPPVVCCDVVPLFVSLGTLECWGGRQEECGPELCVRQLRVCGSQLAVCLVSLFVSVCRSCVSSSSVSRPPIPRWCPVRAWLFFTFLPTYLSVQWMSASPTLGRLLLPISLRSPSPILAATFMPPRGPTLVVLSLVASSSVASLSSASFCDAAAACRSLVLAASFAFHTFSCHIKYIHSFFVCSCGAGDGF